MIKTYFVSRDCAVKCLTRKPTCRHGLYKLAVADFDEDDEKQQFVYEHGVIYCDAKKPIENILYTVQYSDDETFVGCGLGSLCPEAEMNFVPDKVNIPMVWSFFKFTPLPITYDVLGKVMFSLVFVCSQGR